MSSALVAAGAAAQVPELAADRWLANSMFVFQSCVKFLCVGGRQDRVAVPVEDMVGDVYTRLGVFM